MRVEGAGNGLQRSIPWIRRQILYILQLASGWRGRSTGAR